MNQPPSSTQAASSLELQPEETSIVLALDSSGSMGDLKEQTLRSVNAFIKEQQDFSRTLGSDPEFSLITFSNSPTIAINKIRLSQAEEYKSYSPRGGTALLDAISLAIHHVDSIDYEEFSQEVSASLPEVSQDSFMDSTSGLPPQLTSPTPLVPKKKVIIAILTDGAENSSRGITHDELKRLIEQKTQAGWQFLYLGANQDAFTIGASMGIPNSTGFRGNPQGLSEAYQSMSQNVALYRSSINSPAVPASLLPPSTEQGSTQGYYSSIDTNSPAPRATSDNEASPSLGSLGSSRPGLPRFPGTFYPSSN